MVLKNGITINKQELSDEVYKEIVSDLVIINPKYQEAKKKGRRPVQKVKDRYVPIPKYLHFMREFGDKISVPLAYHSKLKKLLNIDDSLIIPPERVGATSISLRSYQELAVDELIKHNYGIISSPAASGKTVMGIAVVHILRMKTLWIAHRGDLATQASKTFEKFSDTEAGFIGDGKYRIGALFTSAIVNSVENNIADVAEEGFELVIVDEVHRAPTTRMFNAIIGLSPKATYGLSATPFREDGLTDILYYMLGPIVVEIPREELVRLGYIVTPTVDIISTGLNNLLTAKMSYPEYIDRLTTSFSRNAVVLEHILLHILNGEICLVLCDRVAHADFIYSVLANLDVNAVIIHGRNKKIKSQLHGLVINRQVSVIVTTYQYFSDGMDIPQLNTLFFTVPFKSGILCEQTVGRVQRICDGKTSAKVIDIIDDNPIAKKQLNARIKVYKKLGCKVNFCSHKSIIHSAS